MTKVFREMVQHDAAGGVFLICAALLALIMANSGINMFYSDFLNMPVVLQLGGFEIAKPLLLSINDGLMALFFFLIGLEVKREILEGHLSSKDQIILPGIAAIAGIVAPALVYVFFNAGDEVGLRGWAIPSATDIAFALGLFSLFGKSLPLTLKLFLLSVAGFGLVGLFILNRLKVRAQAAYIIIGVVVWAAVLKSGVHATLAGFIVAWFIPLNVKTEHGHSMLKQMEHGIQPWIAFFILPVFAFANAGVNLVGIGVEDLFHPVTTGIALGLFVGKQIGIFGACWLAIKVGITSLPKGTTWLQLYGVCILCGIGFTMSLFIGSLAFEGMDAAYQESVKLGVLLGSLLSAVMGSTVIVKSHEQEVPDLRAQQSYS